MNESAEGLLAKPFFPLITYLLIRLSNSNLNTYLIFILTLLLSILYGSTGFFIWDYFSHIGFLIFGLIWAKDNKRFLKIILIFYLCVLLYQTQQFFPSYLNSEESHRLISDNVWGIQNQFFSNINEILFLHHQEVKWHLLLFILLIFSSFIFFKLNIEKKEKKLIIFLIFTLSIGFAIPLIQLVLKDIIPQISIIESGRMYKIVYPFLLCSLFACAIEKIKIKFKNIFLLTIILFFSCIPKINNFIIFLKNGNSYSNLYENNLINKIKKNDKSIFRVASISKNHVSSLLAGNILSSYNLELATGYGNLHYYGYDKFWKKVTKGASFGNRLYLKPTTINIKENLIDLEDNYNLKYLKLTNIKYIFSDFKVRNKGLTLIHEPQDISKLKFKRIRNYTLSDVKNRLREIKNKEKYNSFYIYKLNDFLPRFFMLKSCENIHEDNINLKNINTQSIKVIDYTPDYLNIKISNEFNNRCLIVLNNYSKYWKVKIDNKLTSLNTFSETFWMININKLSKNIEIFYDPPYRKYFKRIYKFK